MRLTPIALAIALLVATSAHAITVVPARPIPVMPRPAPARPITPAPKPAPVPAKPAQPPAAAPTAPAWSWVPFFGSTTKKPKCDDRKGDNCKKEGR
ncbi:hypothetical protein MW290_25655 [Aquincola tertiaricarbonis]|uniref:Uncharacterized protein n=1 Tax=Aquincola tertiaricarbonis TaxID=391953 RepID=A0ABY4SB40_AQUTE|nr:hypothetical protein [Aquincola tertiaricarbonis]URI08958.1 hypothetical protein MW290_25655 [Aquincola tertiaricarbonis]